jgi:hypothetical protein
LRKWKTRAAPDDPNVWSDVSGMWPTTQGTYEVADIYGSPSTLTATGEVATGGGSGVSAWAFKVLSGQRAYVVGTKIWEYSGGTLTDRTGGITLTSTNHMAQYGNITILARGTTQSLASSSGGNFAALAGSPSAKFTVVQSNAVVAFNTSTSSDGWAASDVGDYTNWSTGEAASGRILDNNGPVTAAVPFGGDIIVFKADSIFRMTYVGGVVKWSVQKVWSGTGCYGSSPTGEVLAEPCGDRIIFVAAPASNALFTPDKPQFYSFDGSSAPRLINPDHGFDTLAPVIMYDPTQRRAQFVDYNGANVVPYYYSLDFDAWGRGVDLFGTVGTVQPLPLRGDYSAANAFMGTPFQTTARLIFYSATDSFKLLAPNSPGGSTASSAYVQTSKIGRVDQKTTFQRVTPLLRRRTNNSGGSPACALSASFFRELHDTSAASTQSVTESSTRKRFDFLASDNFGRFKITFTDMDAEIDDVLVMSRSAGTD